MQDLDGLPFTGTRDGVEAFNAAVTAVHALTSDLAENLDSAVAAGPGQPLVRSLRAVIAMPYGLALDPLEELAAADPNGASDRERSFLQAARRFVEASPADAAAAFLEHLSRWPADTAASLPAYVSTMATGDPEAHDLLDVVTEKQFMTAPNWRTAHGAAFRLLDLGQHDEAATIAWDALRERPDGGMVVHVLAHWHYESGSHEAGRRWLDEWRAGRDFTLYRSHFAWHSALHSLAEGEGETAARVLAEQIQDSAIPDVGSLRWRFRLAGLPVPERFEASNLALETARVRNSPMLVWKAACGCAADGDTRSVKELASLVRTWRMPAADLLGKVLDGLASAASGDWASSVDDLDGLTAVTLRHLGGSHAQREVIEDTRVLALIRSNRLDEARQVLEERLARRDHAIDRSWLQECAGPGKVAPRAT